MTIENMIYRIEPTSTPLLRVVRYARVQFRPMAGGSMRQQRRRKAKPIRFTPFNHRIHDWVQDSLSTVDAGRYGHG